MPSIHSASPEVPKPGWVGAHIVYRCATCSIQRRQPRVPPEPWRTSRGGPSPPTQVCTSMPPTVMVCSWGRMRHIMLTCYALGHRAGMNPMSEGRTMAKSDSHVFVGAAQLTGGSLGGLFRQKVGDDRWERLTRGLPEQAAIQAITIHQANSQIVFVGTQDGPYRS